MTCQCIETINGKLIEHNTRIENTFVLSGPRAGMFPVIGTRLIEKKRGQKPMAIVPTFCPFCGVKYEAQAAP